MSDNQYSKLDQKIDLLTEKVDRMGDELSGQILKLYQHMEMRFSEMDGKINGKADGATVDRILNTVDGIAARLDTDQQERAATGHQLNRHEGWIKQLSKNTKTKLVPEA